MMKIFCLHQRGRMPSISRFVLFLENGDVVSPQSLSMYLSIISLNSLFLPQAPCLQRPLRHHFLSKSHVKHAQPRRSNTTPPITSLRLPPQPHSPNPHHHPPLPTLWPAPLATPFPSRRPACTLYPLLGALSSSSSRSSRSS